VFVASRRKGTDFPIESLIEPFTTILIFPFGIWIRGDERLCGNYQNMIELLEKMENL